MRRLLLCEVGDEVVAGELLSTAPTFHQEPMVWSHKTAPTTPETQLQLQGWAKDPNLMPMRAAIILALHSGGWQGAAVSLSACWRPALLP